MSMAERLWVADDMTTLDDRDRRKLYKKLAPLGVGIKVDMALMNTEQRWMVARDNEPSFSIPISKAITARRFARKYGMRVFWDAKLFGNPDALAKAVQGISDMSVSAFTFDASMPAKSIAAIVENAVGALPCGIVALSSYDDDDCISEYSRLRERVACDRAWKLCKNDVKMLVCTGLELRDFAGRGFMKKMDIVVVGVRRLGDGANDHAPKNVVTPTYAIQNGATHLVVGRPITEAPDPIAAAMEFIEEMETATANREQV